jgi:hypothetical protein
MSRIQKITEIFDAFLSKRTKLTMSQSVGQDFDAVCKELFGVSDGFEFISDFSALLGQLEEDIARVPNLRDDQRVHYVRQLEPLRKLFAARAYSATWETFLKQIGPGSLRNSLMLMEPLLDPDRYNLRQMPDRHAISDELNELEKIISDSLLSSAVKRLLQFEVQKMRAIIENEKSFKETKLWEQYQKLTAQLVAVVIDLETEDRNKFAPMLRKLAGRVRLGLGVGADVAQISDTSQNLLTGL